MARVAEWLNSSKNIARLIAWVARKLDRREVWAGDCETDRFVMDAYLSRSSGALYWRGYHEFATVKEFVDFIKLRRHHLLSQRRQIRSAFLLKHFNLYER